MICFCFADSFGFFGVLASSIGALGWTFRCPGGSSSSAVWPPCSLPPSSRRSTLPRRLGVLGRFHFWTWQTSANRSFILGNYLLSLAWDQESGHVLSFLFWASGGCLTLAVQWAGFSKEVGPCGVRDMGERTKFQPRKLGDSRIVPCCLGQRSSFWTVP